MAFLLTALSACSWDRFYERKYVVTSIPAGDGRAILISTDQACEISCGIYYEVKVLDQIVVPMSSICSGDAETLTFKAIFAKEGNLVGVYEETWPERLLLLHDFTTQSSWPRSLPDEGGHQTDSRGLKLLEAFQKEHPNKHFRFAWGGACGVGPPPQR